MNQNSTIQNFVISLMNTPEREPSLTGNSSEIKEALLNRRYRSGSLSRFHLNDLLTAAAEIKNGSNTNSTEMEQVITGLGNLSTRVILGSEDDDPFFV